MTDVASKLPTQRPLSSWVPVTSDRQKYQVDVPSATEAVPAWVEAAGAIALQ